MITTFRVGERIAGKKYQVFPGHFDVGLEASGIDMAAGIFELVLTLRQQCAIQAENPIKVGVLHGIVEFGKITHLCSPECVPGEFYGSGDRKFAD
jgi:hypothetical protein